MSSENEEEAKKAIDLAEKKLSNNDYVGAKKFAYKAQRLHPELNGLKQLLTMIDIYISATSNDWYGVLGVEDPRADNETLKRQYKKLALLIHPDKNKFNAAEGAIKLVLEAWSVLSDEAKRIEYDLERKSKQVKSKMKKKKKKKRDSKAEMFWKGCDRCKRYCQFEKILNCPSCGERMRRCEGFFNEPELYSNEPEGDVAKEEEWLFKKMETENPRRAERVFEKSMGSRNVDSTLEAERLFREPIFF